MGDYLVHSSIIPLVLVDTFALLWDIIADRGSTLSTLSPQAAENVSGARYLRLFGAPIRTARGNLSDLLNDPGGLATYSPKIGVPVRALFAVETLDPRVGSRDLAIAIFAHALLWHADREFDAAERRGEDAARPVPVAVIPMAVLRRLAAHGNKQKKKGAGAPTSAVNIRASLARLAPSDGQTRSRVNAGAPGEMKIAGLPVGWIDQIRYLDGGLIEFNPSLRWRDFYGTPKEEVRERVNQLRTEAIRSGKPIDYASWPDGLRFGPGAKRYGVLDLATLFRCTRHASVRLLMYATALRHQTTDPNSFRTEGPRDKRGYASGEVAIGIDKLAKIAGSKGRVNARDLKKDLIDPAVNELAEVAPWTGIAVEPIRRPGQPSQLWKLSWSFLDNAATTNLPRSAIQNAAALIARLLEDVPDSDEVKTPSLKESKLKEKLDDICRILRSDLKDTNADRHVPFAINRKRSDTPGEMQRNTYLKVASFVERVANWANNSGPRDIAEASRCRRPLPDWIGMIALNYLKEQKSQNIDADYEALVAPLIALWNSTKKHSRAHCILISQICRAAATFRNAGAWAYLTMLTAEIAKSAPKVIAAERGMEFVPREAQTHKNEVSSGKQYDDQHTFEQEQPDDSVWPDDQEDEDEKFARLHPEEQRVLLNERLMQEMRESEDPPDA